MNGISPLGVNTKSPMGGLRCDDFTYSTSVVGDMVPGTDPETWWLSGWYTFEIVEDLPVNIIYDDIFSIMDTGD